jgi:hypothetical protein
MSCNEGDGFLNGVQYRSEAKISGDNTDGNTVKMVCTDEALLGSNGGNRSSWTNMASCPFRTAICGIKTKVELPHNANTDDTTLNNVEFFCCKLPE